MNSPLKNFDEPSLSKQAFLPFLGLPHLQNGFKSGVSWLKRVTKTTAEDMI